jgi:hypothetical protein
MRPRPPHTQAIGGFLGAARLAQSNSTVRSAHSFIPERKFDCTSEQLQLLSAKGFVTIPAACALFTLFTS